ncbi:hypothetical protein C1645_820297 [Glomus cerebriforme]|uniref:F-box domain-containing protein n=1 Tax=Glomus cerebriforme TaxID=658196 RepID=A0A397T314_9GLOM|nr:hypothetical protein C1645_820297 [Glomus cerebriforme]
MSCQLTIDCLNEIFENLDDKKTLHSLSTAILSTLVACLSNESKELLFKNEIFISTPTSKPPLFNYPAFCKVLSIDNIYLIIGETTPIFTALRLKDRSDLVVNEVVKMFLTQISSLKKLTFYTYITVPNDFFVAIDCLTDLSELHCSSELPPEFFYHLSKICHNLHSLIIDIHCFYRNSENYGLNELISSQNNLKFLDLSATNDGHWIDIIPTLTKHSNTLNTLTKLHLFSERNYLPVSFIALFPNLQEIRFLYIPLTEGFQFRDFEELQNVTFPKLKYLAIPVSCTKPKYFIKFLENNGKNLENFYLEESDHALKLSIAKFCPNLKNLSISLENSELDTLRIIFISCQYLESIEILCGSYWLKEKEVLETIAKYSPKNFYKLKINSCSHSELLPEDLESFFISWKNRTPLALIIIDGNKYFNEENEENINIIKKYINLEELVAEEELTLEETSTTKTIKGWIGSPIGT